MSFFCWKALNSLLPTDDVLRSRGVAITSRCEFCSSIAHVCGAVAAQAWQFSLLPLSLCASSCLSSVVISWALSSQGNWLQHVRCVISLAIMWLGRNEARYEGSPLVARWLIDLAASFHLLVLQSQARSCRSFSCRSSRFRCLALSSCFFWVSSLFFLMVQSVKRIGRRRYQVRKG